LPLTSASIMMAFLFYCALYLMVTTRGLPRASTTTPEPTKIRRFYLDKLDRNFGGFGVQPHLGLQISLKEAVSLNFTFSMDWVKIAMVVMGRIEKRL